MRVSKFLARPREPAADGMLSYWDEQTTGVAVSGLASLLYLSTWSPSNYYKSGAAWAHLLRPLRAKTMILASENR